MYAMEYSSDICNDMVGLKSIMLSEKLRQRKTNIKFLLHVEKQRTDQWLPEASGRRWEKHSNGLFK